MFRVLLAFIAAGCLLISFYGVGTKVPVTGSELAGVFGLGLLFLYIAEGKADERHKVIKELLKERLPPKTEK